MRRLLKFLFGCALGASAALLVTPKRGSEMRQKLFSPQVRELVSGRVGELMKPRGMPGDEPYGAYTTRVDEPPVEVEEPPVEVEEPPVEVEEPVAEADEDLRDHIEATKAALVSEIEQPFEEPVAEEPVAEEPVAEEPVAEEPVAEEPVVEEPIVEEPIAEEPVVEEPIVEEPVVEEPIVEEPVAEEPVAEEPLAVETTDEPEAAGAEPMAIDQAEMRRRIEETRARLKAKAFDAMMSGEAALLARDSGDEVLTKEPEIEVDGEVANTIDESLSQEDY
jgi:hypothetical protein